MIGNDKDNNFSYKIVSLLSEKGRITRSELYTKLDSNSCRCIDTTDVDNALLSLHKIGCITKSNTYIRKKNFTVKYNGKHRDLGLFIDIVKYHNKQEHLYRLAEHLKINKELTELIINSNPSIYLVLLSIRVFYFSIFYLFFNF